jgi:hypothetical protein
VRQKIAEKCVLLVTTRTVKKEGCLHASGSHTENIDERDME